MEKILIPQPISGGLMLSYKCPAECRHCMYACSPRWKGDWITIEQLEEHLPKLAAVIQPSPYGREHVSLSHGLHFSGGEPFMNYALLLEAVELAEALEIPSTFVETNGFWCTSDDLTRERLEAIKAKGLKGIMISVNPYYAEYVPFERTERCIRISREVFEPNMMVYQLAYYHLFKRLGMTGKLSAEAVSNLTKGESLSDRVELFLMGRAVDRLKDLYPGFPPDRFLGTPCRPEFLRSWHNHFDNYGNFMPGFCGGISLGSWFELDRLLAEGIDLTDRPVLNYLVHEDMGGLLNFARDRGYQEIEQGYVSKCHLCLDIRKHLAAAGDFKELEPKPFYAQFAQNA